ncbi:4302_t:CDS:2, partial [Acaulospora colombiana]
ELEILEGKFGPRTNQRKKVVALLRALKVSTFALQLLHGRASGRRASATYPCATGERPDIESIRDIQLEKKGSVSLRKRKVDHENDDDSVCEVEELHVDVNEFPDLLEYCQNIKEMQENHIDEISQLGRHLSILLKWSVVDSKLFKTPVTSPIISRPALNLHNLKVIFKEYPDLQADNILDALIEDKKIGIFRTNGWLEWLGLKKQNHVDYFYLVDTYTTLSAIIYPSEAHVKIQLWSKILSDSFTLNQVRFEPTWELNHLIPGNAKEGSSRSDFSAVILNSRQWQFPFFIVEFEQHGFEVHKDFAVVVCEVAFELNKILSRTQGLLPAETIKIKIYVGLINDTSINIGVIRPIFNNDKTAILFAYDRDIVSYNIQTGCQHNNVKNVLDLIVYFRQIVCRDGLVIKDFLEKSESHHNQSISKVMPELPKMAEKSREALTKITPKKKRVKYTYTNGIENLLEIN